MWTLQQFEEIFDRYQSSGLRIKEFCRNEPIVESRFVYWRKKRLQEHNYRTARRVRFVPIVFTGSNHCLQTKQSIKNRFRCMLIPYQGIFLEIVYPMALKCVFPLGLIRLSCVH